MGKLWQAKSPAPPTNIQHLHSLVGQAFSLPEPFFSNLLNFQQEQKAPLFLKRATQTGTGAFWIWFRRRVSDITSAPVGPRAGGQSDTAG
jgi:hypothetical protein